MMRGNRMQGNRRKLIELAQATTIAHHALEGMLPAGSCVAVDIETGTISLLANAEQGREGHPLLKRQQLVSGNEVSLLLPLLEAYPDYCPYEVLMAHYVSVDPTPEKIDAVRERLHQALADGAGAWDQEMRPVRNTIPRLRIRLRHLGLTVSVVLDAGYLLMPAEASHLKRAHL